MCTLYSHVHFEGLPDLLDPEVELAVNVGLRGAEGVAHIHNTHCVLEGLCVVYLDLSCPRVCMTHFQHHRESRLVVLENTGTHTRIYMYMEGIKLSMTHTYVERYSIESLLLSNFEHPKQSVSDPTQIRDHCLK